MRHFGRFHRIAVAWMHERLLAGDFTLFYEKSELMAADIYTKSFSDKGKWTSVGWLINVVDPKMFKTMIGYNADLKVRLADEEVVKESARVAAKAEAKAKTKPKAKPKAKSKVPVLVYFIGLR